MERTTAAYVAAIIDTQGLITVRNTGTSIIPVLAVSSPNMPMLNWLGELTGVTAFPVKRDYHRLLCSEHCDEPHVHVQSVTGRWSLTGAKATVLLHNVIPHMQFQTEMASEALRIGLNAPSKAATWAKMRELGWTLPRERITEREEVTA
jgi:hypothetical protein